MREMWRQKTFIGNKVVTCDYEYGGWATYDTSARVDVDDDIEESDEDNNEYHEDVVPIH